MNVAGYEHLQPGGRYRVARAFVDFDGLHHEVGECFIFFDHSFLPHDDGHTFATNGRSFRLHGWDQREILNHLADYFVADPALVAP